MKRKISLEPAAEELCKKTSNPPFLFQMPPQEGRKILEDMQDEPVFMYPACVSQRVYQTGSWGKIPMYLVEPETTQPIRSIIFYIHGAGWVFGSFHTHEKLVRELAARTNSLVVFPEYTRSPEVCYPTAMEQCYCMLNHLSAIADSVCPDIDMRTLTVAGDSVGGNMAIAMTLLSKCRYGAKIHKQLLFYPVTNACFDTCSYQEFAEGCYLYREGMKWFWQQYAPAQKMRNMVTASPLRTDIEDLQFLPPAMIINGEADVLRDEGLAYAAKLRMAGVDVTSVQIQGTVHDFVMLHALDRTNACRTAMDMSIAWINRKNREHWSINGEAEESTGGW